MQEFLDALGWLLGVDTEAPDLNVLQMALRALVIYITTFITVQIGKRRFLGKSTLFDVILGVILGSIASRAINGSAPLLPTVVSGVVLVALHAALSEVSYRSAPVGRFFKGEPRVLYKDGEIDQRELHAHNITEEELVIASRENANRDSLDDIAQATLEPSGKISIVHKKPERRIYELPVKNGVQTVRIELD